MQQLLSLPPMVISAIKETLGGNRIVEVQLEQAAVTDLMDCGDRKHRSRFVACSHRAGGGDDNDKLSSWHDTFQVRSINKSTSSSNGLFAKVDLVPGTTLIVDDAHLSSLCNDSAASLDWPPSTLAELDDRARRIGTTNVFKDEEDQWLAWLQRYCSRAHLEKHVNIVVVVADDDDNNKKKDKQQWCVTSLVKAGQQVSRLYGLDYWIPKFLADYAGYNEAEIFPTDKEQIAKELLFVLLNSQQSQKERDEDRRRNHPLCRAIRQFMDQVLEPSGQMSHYVRLLGVRDFLS